MRRIKKDLGVEMSQIQDLKSAEIQNQFSALIAEKDQEAITV